MRSAGLSLLAIASLVITSSVSAQAPSFLTFESGQVRPLALSPDGTTLFAVNTPDNQLEIFDIDISGDLSRAGVVQVGMEPVAVAARTNTEAWVVNYLSDSVSVVDLSGTAPRVVRTLLVGDEPSDIVFAGPGGNRAFITTTHRGQNSLFPRSQYNVGGVGRADVWVFDATNLGPVLGGDPETVITLFSDKPRALAVSPDGSRVYAAAFRSGNQTTTVSEGAVCNTSGARLDNGTVQPACNVNGFTAPGGSPPPHKNQQGINRPETGLIVKFNRDGGTSNEWQDELGRNWNDIVRFNLPDRDVFEIDANANPPAAINAGSMCNNGVGCWAGVGTILFNMAVNPVSGKIYVSNTDAQNDVRFEGPGALATGIKPPGEPTTVQGNLAQSRITILDGADVLPRHLNKHIDYSIRPAPAGVKNNSLSTPLGMAVSSDGNTLYVAAFGSNKIGIFGTAALENDTFVPNAANHIQLSGGGPSGVVLSGNRLYVLTRFDNTVTVVDLGSNSEVQVVPLHNPEPDIVVDGRPFLYDAVLTSSNGEASCASCHIFGDMDDLAWDLGNPDDNQVANTNDFNPVIPAPLDPLPRVFHPMKGPMTTQSLRGLVNMGPEHWRGDRQGDGIPGNNGMDEILAFEAFNVAFPGLVGRNSELTAAQMTAFRRFVMEIRYPPNPIRQLINALRPDEASGLAIYTGPITDTVANCQGCHTINASQGFFGGDGRSTFEGETQHFKVAHLRNAYQKIGMFGFAQPLGTSFDGPFGHQGDQVRGFGFLHDGAIDTVFRFLSSGVFTLSPAQQNDLEAFIMAFPTDLAPVVGQQITLTNTNTGVATPRVNLLINRADQPFVSKILGGNVTECDLIVKGTIAGEQRGALYLGSGSWRSDRAADPLLTTANILNLPNTPGQEGTFTCAPPGSGTRMGIDRDQDGFFDRDEIDAGSDPADPFSVPGGTTTTTITTTTTTTVSMSTTTTLPAGLVNIQTTALRLRDDSSPPVNLKRRRVRFRSVSKFDPMANQIVPPLPGTAGDPTASGGGVVSVYNAAGGTEVATVALPASGWKRLGTPTSPKGYRFRDADPAAPIRRVKVKANRIVFAGGGENWPYTLDESSQGSVAVRLTLGFGTSWCAQSGQLGFPPKRDEVDLYVGLRKTPPPPSCPPFPGGSPSGAFVDVGSTLY